MKWAQLLFNVSWYVRKLSLVTWFVCRCRLWHTKISWLFYSITLVDIFSISWKHVTGETKIACYTLNKKDCHNQVTCKQHHLKIRLLSSCHLALVLQVWSWINRHVHPDWRVLYVEQVQKSLRLSSSFFFVSANWRKLKIHGEKISTKAFILMWMCGLSVHRYVPCATLSPPASSNDILWSLSSGAWVTWASSSISLASFWWLLW